MKLFIKGILVYTTLITIIILICSLDSILFSNWFITIIGIIVTEIILINKYVYWDELKRILFLK